MKSPNGYGGVYFQKGRRRPWVARVTTGWTDEGDQIRQNIGSFETKQEALDALAMSRVTPVSPKTNLTLEALYEEWSAKKYQQISKSTADNYRAAWKHIKVLSRSKFKDLRPKNWQEIIDSLEASRSTHEKIRTLISLLYNYALQNDIVAKHYGRYIVLPKSNQANRDAFTDLEIKKMVEKDNQVPWVDSILIMIFTGMRVGEMLALTRFNVDIEKRIIIGGLKTEAGKNRMIPIHSKILPYVKKYYDQGGQALICKEDGSKISTDYYRRRLYYPALEKLEVQVLPPHSCRHTFASLLARARANTVHIQKLMGHTDYAFTANKYTHTEVEELLNTVESI